MPRSPAEAFHEVLYGLPPATGCSKDTLGKPIAARLRNCVKVVTGDYTHYKPGLPVGKSMVQVGRIEHNNELTGSDDETFERMGQAIASARDLVSIAFANVEDKKTKKWAILPCSDLTG